MSSKKTNLIGISGRIGAGKDTVGQMIQFLTMKQSLKTQGSVLYGKVDHFDIFSRWDNQARQSYSGWEIKKFAYKLKLICSILTGVDVEKFEDAEFKKKKMGHEWLNKKWDGLKMKHYNELITYRELLQKVGTEAMRDKIHPQIWINALFADYHSIGGTMDVQRTKEEYPNWIITDLRFPNEAESIRKRGGKIIRLERNFNRENQFEGQPHISETALDDYHFDAIILNDGSKDALLEMVQSTLVHLNILSE